MALLSTINTRKTCAKLFLLREQRAMLEWGPEPIRRQLAVPQRGARRVLKGKICYFLNNGLFSTTFTE